MTDAAAACRVLLVEDEFLIAMLVEDMLAEFGHALAATAGDLAAALVLARGGCVFDVALLDLMLRGVASYPVADVLRARGIPFAFVTGRAGDDIDPGYAAVPILRKPFRRDDLAATIAALLSQGRGPDRR
jgi:CheY-like chemotaxis protein